MKYFQDFDQALKQDRIAPVYLFFGDEVYLHRKAVEKLRDKLLAPGTADFDLTVLDGEETTPVAIVRAAQTMPVFNPIRLTVVQRAAFLGTTGRKAGSGGPADREPPAQEPLRRYLEAPLSSACLVFCVPGAVDKRRKIYKMIAERGEAIDFKLLERPDTAKWLNREAGRAGKRFAPGALARLQEWAPAGLNELSCELEKVLLHAGDSPVIQVSDVEAVVVPTREETIFQVVDAVSVKNGAAALEGIRGLLSVKEPPLRILGMLARQFRLIACVRDLAGKGMRDEEIASRLETKPFVVRKIRGQARRFSCEQALQAWAECLEIDTAVKSGRKEFLPAVTDMLIRISADR